MTPACRCGVRDYTAEHKQACDHRAELLGTIHDYNAQLDKPAGKVHVEDLFAHARTVLHDDDLASLLTKTVLALGWRKTVGGRT